LHEIAAPARPGMLPMARKRSRQIIKLD